jgi:hypothetical protein
MYSSCLFDLAVQPVCQRHALLPGGTCLDIESPLDDFPIIYCVSLAPAASAGSRSVESGVSDVLIPHLRPHRFDSFSKRISYHY